MFYTFCFPCFCFVYSLPFRSKVIITKVFGMDPVCAAEVFVNTFDYDDGLTTATILSALAVMTAEVQVIDFKLITTSVWSSSSSFFNSVYPLRDICSLHCKASAQSIQVLATATGPALLIIIT